MAMMEKFDKNFVERTIDILKKEYDRMDYEVTFLLNCLLALITLPNERKNNNDKRIKKFKLDCVHKLNELKGEIENEIFDDNDDYTFSHVRNSIAHLHIEVDKGSYENTIERIILRDARDNILFNKGEYNFSISISVKNLKEYAIYVAENYLKLMD